MRDFIQALMLGTSRLSGAPPAPHAALEEAWQQLPWVQSPELALLDAAALLGTARTAGRPIAEGLPEPSRSVENGQPSAGVAAVALLPRLLSTEFRPLLGEWLERCAAQKQCVPPFFLPRLLEAAQQSERSAVSLVVGERGRWLARQNASWSWVLAGARSFEPALWETGVPAERLACLRQWRATEPAIGLEKLRQTWETESPEFRLEALAALGVGLSKADEEFLTGILGERRKELRQQAQTLLASLPESAWSTRLRTRTGSYLALKRGLLSKRLELTLPSAFDPAWKAEGFEEKPPAGVGERTFWIQQMLARIPVGHWTSAFGITPETLFKLAMESEWAEVLLGSWFRAIQLDRDAQAAEALVPIMASNPKYLPVGTPLPQALSSLLALAPETSRWSNLEKFGKEVDLVWSWLREVETPPTLKQSRILLQLVCPSLRDGFNPGGSTQAMLAARWISPELRTEAEKLVARDAGLSKPAEAFLQALDLRAALHSAFQVPLS